LFAATLEGIIPTRGEALERYVKHFRREGGGNWVCIEAATLDLPQGRVQVAPGQRFSIGAKFMNVEVARLLDEAYSRAQQRRNPG
jgi:hypothetical protein